MPPVQRRRSLKPANIVGDRVRQGREAKGLSQSRCAHDLQLALHDIYPGINMEIDQSDVSRIERGERPVWDYELCALSKVLGVTSDWLLQAEPKSNAAP